MLSRTLRHLIKFFLDAVHLQEGWKSHKPQTSENSLAFVVQHRQHFVRPGFEATKIIECRYLKHTLKPTEQEVAFPDHKASERSIWPIKAVTRSWKQQVKDDCDHLNVTQRHPLRGREHRLPNLKRLNSQKPQNCCGNTNWSSLEGKQHGGFSKIKYSYAIDSIGNSTPRDGARELKDTNRK